MLLDVNRDAGKRARASIPEGNGDMFSADDLASLAGDDEDPLDGADGSDALQSTDDEGSLADALY